MHRQARKKLLDVAVLLVIAFGAYACMGICSTEEPVWHIPAYISSQGVSFISTH